MAKFEVFIPAAGPGGMDLTFRVEADNWLAALNTGLKKIGEKGGAGANVLVDIQDDNSIHVTDPKSQRVFRISEMEPPQAAPEPATLDTPPEANPFDPQPGTRTQIDLPAVRPPSRPQQPALAPRPASQPAANPAAATVLSARPLTEPATPAFAPAAPQPRFQTPTEPVPAAKLAPAVNQVKPAAPAPARPAAPITASNAVSRPTSSARPKSGVPRKPSGVAQAVTEVPREQTRPHTGRIGRMPTSERENIDEVLGELFDRVQELDRYTDPEEALDFVLDLAMEKIAAEAGSVFIADLSTNDLSLGAARGPKANDLLRLNPRVPMGVGIVGFCAQEGVSLAISDAQRDPRFFRAISDRIGYPTKTILCVPMVRNGRSFGCLEVLNKRKSDRFTEGEVAILGYLADATARYLESVG